MAGLLLCTGCDKPKKTGLFSGPIEPSLSGDWDGVFKTSGSEPIARFNLSQSNLNISGSYSASHPSVSVFGEQGSIRGLTTGQSFMLTFTASAPADCVAKIDINGHNSGDELAFNFTGVDCSCSTISGQGYGQRPG